MSPLGGCPMCPSTSTSPTHPTPITPISSYNLLTLRQRNLPHDPSSNWGDRPCCGWNLSFLLQIHFCHLYHSFSQLAQTTSITLDIPSEQMTKSHNFSKKHIFNNKYSLVSFYIRDIINEIVNTASIGIWYQPIWMKLQRFNVSYNYLVKKLLL